jgi:hypothetical protein
MTGRQTDATICGTRGLARLSTSVVIPRETFVHLVLVRILVLTGHRPKTWVVVKWYYSGKDIEEHGLGESDSLGMYVSTVPQALSSRETRGSGTNHPTASLSAAPPKIAK